MIQLIIPFLLSVLSLFFALGLSLFIKRMLAFHKILGAVIFVLLFPIVLVAIVVLFCCILAIAITFFSLFL